MKLKEKVQIFKENNPDRLQHTFKDGSIFKGTGNYKLHYWVDMVYKESENEYFTKKTTFLAKFLDNIIA